MVKQKLENTAGATSRIETFIAKALHQSVQVASHDDDTPERVQTMAALGVKFSEFPVNLETATISTSLQMATIFGAPNILWGSKPE